MARRDYVNYTTVVRHQVQLSEERVILNYLYMGHVSARTPPEAPTLLPLSPSQYYGEYGQDGASGCHQTRHVGIRGTHIAHFQTRDHTINSNNRLTVT